MSITFLIGIIGSLILVTGAAWPESKNKQPIKSIKDWLFTAGSLCMLGYATLGYLSGGSVFFVFLQIFIAFTTVLMMIDIDDKIDATIIAISGLGFIGWSFYLFEGYNTIFFIIGLTGIGLGYVFKMGTLRRPVALTLGSALIAIFSYLTASWIFFWLNVFFAIFSGYYVVKGLIKK